MPFSLRLRSLLSGGAGLLLAAAACCLAPRAEAVTANDIAPANFVGRTFQLRYSGNRTFETNLSLTNNLFTIQFTSATNYVREGSGTPGIVTEGGTYSITASAEVAGIRTTVVTFHNNFTAPGSTTPVVITFLSVTNEVFASTFALSSGTATAGGTYGIISGGGGGATGVPVIPGPTQLTATVGTPFTYALTAAPAATSWENMGGDAPVAISPGSGLVTGTFTRAGTFRFSVRGLNAAGAGATVTFTVTAVGSSLPAIPQITSAPTARGTIGLAFSYQITATNSPVSYAASGLPPGLTLNPASGLISGTPTGSAATRDVILSATNGGGSTTVPVTFIIGSASGGGGGTTPPAIAAPVNLVGYRNRVGSVFQFTVTGATRGAVWGTDVYTDDSSVAVAAVHAGVLRSGETGTVTLTILPGQSSYAASVRNGVSAASWGAWSGSYSFAGAGVVAGVPAATARPAAAPGFVAGTTQLAAGGRLVCPVNVTGGGTYTYRWYLNGLLIPGATANPYIVEAITSAHAGIYSVDVTNALGTTRVTAGTLSVGAAGSPVLALHPVAKTVAPGATFTLATNASGSGLSYQWLRNGVALAGETGAILLRQNAGANDSGSYAVRVTNSAGSVVSNAATITLSPDASRPANISVRTNVATGATVIPGFFVQGTGTKRVLIRAVGPGLAAFGLGGTMGDPKFEVFQGGAKIAENDQWSAANVGQAFSATGAFALTAGSADAALVTDLQAGKEYTVQVTNASGSGGIVLIEVYDADVLTGRSSSKLVNVSVRGQTAPGDDILTLGVVIGGIGPRTLLVRGVGPKLAAFGVTGTVADPALQIFDSQQRAILANDDWSGADFVGELVLATQYVGAFALDNASKDAATLTLVEPGAYTIQVGGAASAPGGEALVEVYEVP